MSFFRWDVLFLGFVLALPVLLLGMRGDLPVSVMMGRLPWCLLASWVIVSLLRWATTPSVKRDADATHGQPFTGPLDGLGADHEAPVSH